MKVKKVALIVFFIISALGGVGLFLFTRPHPSVAQCERLLISRLKSPSSYKAISKEMMVVVTEYDALNAEESHSINSALIHIEYEAANSFNAIIKGDCYCTMGAFPADKRKNSYALNIALRKNQIGLSPFDTLNIVEVEMDGRKTEPGDIPISMALIDPNPFYTKPGPGYILGWRGDGSTDYILSKEKPSQTMVDGLKAAMQEDYAKQKDYLDKIIEIRKIMSLNDATRLDNLAYGICYGVSQDEVKPALANLYDTESTQEIVRNIQEQQAEVKKLIEEIQKPPKGLEEYYSIISEMYASYVNYINSVITPYGAINECFHRYTMSRSGSNQLFSRSMQQWGKFMDYGKKLDNLLPNESDK